VPVDYPIVLRPVSDADFDAIDRLVMAASYASQNHLGRLCDERVYETDVAARLTAEGFQAVLTQLPVKVSHRTFAKAYRLDLIVDSVLYEFKNTADLAPKHSTQAIHYAALTESSRVKLVNFGAARVAGHLLRIPFPRADRRQVMVVRDRWNPLSDRCESLTEHFVTLLKDWGGFLEARLYE
jgi:GxxExxY protein